MSTERSSVQQPLARKLATDGDWSTATTSPDSLLKVEIQTTEPELAEAERAVTDAGGDIQVSYKTGIIADVRADSVYEIADSEAVRLIGEPAQPMTLEKPIPGFEGEFDTDSSHSGIPQTEGKQITNADTLHARDVTGEGTTVCILDNAFDVNNEQYADQVVGTLWDEDDLAGGFSDYYEAPDAHGDNCADIVASMAPGADIVVGTVFDPNTTLVGALDQIEQNFPEVDVVSFSVGYTTTTRIDGNDFRSQRIEAFTSRDGQRNRTFVNSAGNDAPSELAWQYSPQAGEPVPIPLGGGGPHWDGEYTDTSGNFLLEFDSRLQNPERLPVQLTEDRSGDPDSAFIGWINVHWDGDFNTDDKDYKVRLYTSPTASDPVIESHTKAPYESITLSAGDFEEATEGDRLYVEVQNVDADGNQHFDVWAQFGPPLEIPGPFATAPRTVGIPGVARDDDLLAIAAVQAVDVGPNEGETLVAFDDEKGDLATYSSQGPTQDGRRGIDYAAPSHVSTNAGGPVEDVFGFNGTSAACPHVAGATALLYESSATTSEIRAAFSATGDTIADPSVPGTDNTKIGDGQIDVLEAALDLDLVSSAQSISLSTQALDLTAGDSELSVDVGEADAGDWVVITTTPSGSDLDPADYAAADVDIVAARQLDATAEDTITLDVSGASPVDHTAHIATSLSSDTEPGGTLSLQTAANVVASSDPAPIYAVAQFDWQDEPLEDLGDPGTVTVDTVEVAYTGDRGPTTISIDLHEFDGGPGAFIGVSQNDLDVGTVHNDVTIDVLEPVSPTDLDPDRVETDLEETGQYFAMAHLGPAGTNSSGERVPAQKPALQTTAQNGKLQRTIGDVATVETPPTLNTQALDLRNNDSTLKVDSVTADNGDYVVVTTVPDSGTYEGEDVVGFTQASEDLRNASLGIDVSGASPVDHAVHIITDLSSNTTSNLTVSSTTLSNVRNTSDPAAVYAVAQFDWTDETDTAAVGTVTADVVEVLYNGTVGPSSLSVDLHEFDGGPGAFVGVSQNDLAVNTVHNDVTIDVLQSVTPEEVANGTAERVDSTISRTDDYSVMLHVGPAATGQNGGRVPAGQPALLTTDSNNNFVPLNVDATVTIPDVDIQIQGSYPVPNRTLVTDEGEDSRFGADQYELSAIKAAEAGDSLEVNVASSTDSLNYNVEIFDDDLNRQAFKAGVGTDTVTFESSDTSGLDPGTYLVAVIKDGSAIAVEPLVIEGYAAEITGVSPADPQTGDTLTVTASISEVDSSVAALEDVLLAGFTDSDDSGLAVRMDQVQTGTYEVSVSDPPAEEYQLHVAPRSVDEVSFEIQGTSVQETSPTGDLSTDSAQTDMIGSASSNEMVGLSPAENVTVDLADTDALAQSWSSSEGQSQFSQPALDNENVYFGGLDEFVTGHARNSGEQRWEVQRAGALSDSSPVVYDGTIYIGDGGGLLHAIDADTGSVNWSYDTADETSSPASAITSTPGVFEDSNGNVWVFFGANNGTIHAVIDNGSGFTQQWALRYGEGYSVFSDLETGVVLDLPWVFVTTADGRVLVIDPTGLGTGQAGGLLVDYDAPTSSFGSSSPVVVDETLYVAGDVFASVDVAATVNNASSLPITDVVPNWVQQGYGGSAGSNPVVTDTGVYVGSGDGNLYAMRRSDGEVLWQGSTEGPITGTPAVANGRVVVGSLDQSLYVFDQATGEEIDSRSFGASIRSGPVALNDNVYVGLEDGTVRNFQNIP